MTAPDMIICEFCGVPNERTGSCVKCGAPLPISPAQKARDDFFNRPYTIYNCDDSSPKRHENANLFIKENGVIRIGGEFSSYPTNIITWTGSAWVDLGPAKPAKRSIFSGVKNYFWRIFYKGNK